MLHVDPDPVALATRQALLARYDIPVRTASDGFGVFGMDAPPEPGTVVLSQRLGRFHLEAVAEYARHRWPWARILVLGSLEPTLEEQLYDETLPGSCNNLEFLRAIERSTRLRNFQHRR